MPRASSASSVPEKHRTSTIQGCPGWNGTTCGVVIGRDREPCGLCRQEQAAAGRAAAPAPEPAIALPAFDLGTELALDAVPMPPAAEEPPPRPVRPAPIAPERTPAPPPPPPAKIPAAPETVKLHWAPLMPCGNMPKHVEPHMAETEDAVTCGRCRRILGKTAREPAPEPPLAGRGQQLSAGHVKALRDADAEAERLRNIGPRMGENRVRIDLTHYDTIRGPLRRVVGF